MDVSVDQLLEKKEPQIRMLAQGVREVIRKAIPEAEERVKWSSPTYEVDGKNVACIMIYSGHVNLGFFMGAKMKPERLEGTGKGLRHVKICELVDIDDKELTRILKEVVSMAKQA